MKQWVNYIMVTLIAMQSITSIADSYIPQLSDEQDLAYEFTIAHSHNENSTLNTVDNPSHSLNHEDLDCHHCGNCHGTHLSFLIASNDTSNSLNNISINHFNNIALSGSASSLFRPPKH